MVTNRRREGVYAGAMTMAGKLVRASIVFVLGVILSAYGFESKSHIQPQSAIDAINGIILYGVVGMALIGAFFAWRMKLDHATHSIIINEVARIRQGGKMEDVTPETRKVVEELSGIAYDKCFGNNNIGFKQKETTTK